MTLDYLTVPTTSSRSSSDSNVVSFQ